MYSFTFNLLSFIFFVKHVSYFSFLSYCFVVRFSYNRVFFFVFTSQCLSSSEHIENNFVMPKICLQTNGPLLPPRIFNFIFKMWEKVFCSTRVFDYKRHCSITVSFGMLGYVVSAT